MKLRSVFLLWFCWCVVVLSFQVFSSHRIKLFSPDLVLPWTKFETMNSDDISKQYPYINNPFMNNQIAWDSEFYLSIATAGYDDPVVPQVRDGNNSISINYAFMPLYPFLMKILSQPFAVFMSTVSSAALAGVLISLLGTLAAMVALFFLVASAEGEKFVLGNSKENDDAFRAVFYMIIFPSSFFFAQVYTEGLFAGLSFSCLALIRYKKYVWASLLAVLAAWTRGVGFVLFIPLIWAWYQTVDLKNSTIKSFVKKDLLSLIIAMMPIAAFLVWKFSPIGSNFLFVEEKYFGRSVFAIIPSIKSWAHAFVNIFGNNPQMSMYYILEYFALCLAGVSCIATFRKYPALSLYSAALIGIPLISGDAQGMIRFAVVVPSVYIWLSSLGRKIIFDKVWTMISMLLFALLTVIFTCNQWVA